MSYEGSIIDPASLLQAVKQAVDGIAVTSRIGEGSEFWFTVCPKHGPGAGGHAEAAQPQAQTAVHLNGRILIAEDNSTNR